MALPDPQTLNNFFLNTLTNSIPDAQILNYLTNQKLNEDTQQFKLKTIEENEIFKILLSIKSKSVGPDGIGITMLLMSCPKIIPVLKHIFDFCILNNIFPSIWKKSHVIPLPNNQSYRI